MKRVFTVIGVIATLALAACAVWLAMTPQPTTPHSPTPRPTVTVGAPTSTPSPTAPSPDDDDDSCLGGPDGTCEQLGVSTLTAEENDAAYLSIPKVKAFATQWVRSTSAETAAQRAARLSAVGAGADVASRQTKLARADSALQGLREDTALREFLLVTPVGKGEKGVEFSVSLNAVAEYRTPDGVVTDHAIGGTLDIWMAADGTVTDVSENFPALSGLH